MHTPHHHRRGFTLVEMMVAMALTVFIMVILSQCFVQGLETFSQLKAVGDMQEELRTATTLLRADLSLDHFEGKRRLSDPPIRFTSERIREGFFAIGQGYPPRGSSQASEGAEDGIASVMATDHWLHFTAKMRGNARERFFVAPASPAITGQSTDLLNNANLSADAVFQESGDVFHSAWAEIAYFLLPTGTTLNPSVPGGPGTPLYALYRCQYAVLPEPTRANTLFSQGKLPGKFPNIARGPNKHFLSPNDLAQDYMHRTFDPHGYFHTPPVDNSNQPVGSSLILSNVISFRVQVMKNTSGGEFVDLGVTGVNPQTSRNSPVPFDTANYVNGITLPFGVYGVALTPVPPDFTISGLQITIRIWDPKSQITRQVTVLQDM